MNKLFLLLTAIMATLGASAYDFEANGLYYSILSEDEMTCGLKQWIINTDDPILHSNYSGDIEIPETVEHDGKTYTVTEILKNAFYGSSELISVKIPNSIVKIGDGAFVSCNKLKSIVIPNSVKEIGRDAFNGCIGLKSVVLPNSLTEINPYLFRLCTSLTDVEIPSSVTRIGDAAFQTCTSLKSINIPASVTDFGFSESGTGNGSSNTYNPFLACSALENISVEGDLFTFEKDCLVGPGFGSAKAVRCVLNKEKITIPESADFINNHVFLYMDKLETVEFPESVKGINWGNFYECPNLTSICIYGFMTTLVLPETSELNPDFKIYVPKNYLEEYKEKYPEYADKIEAFDFSYYEVGDDLTDEAGNRYEITSVEEGNKTCKVTINHQLTEANIPECVEGFTVTAVNLSPSNITKLVLPKTIKSIRNKAFSRCSKLTEVYIFAESMDEYGTEVFKISSSLKIYVPENSVEIYKAAWPEAADNIFPMDETMAIRPISADGTRHAKTINLQGQPVDDTFKGIVIQNGKKMLRK